MSRKIASHTDTDTNTERKRNLLLYCLHGISLNKENISDELQIVFIEKKMKKKRKKIEEKQKKGEYQSLHYIISWIFSFLSFVGVDFRTCLITRIFYGLGSFGFFLWYIRHSSQLEDISVRIAEAAKKRTAEKYQKNVSKVFESKKGNEPG